MKKIIYWLPRVLAIMLTLFFSVFILESFGNVFYWINFLMHFAFAFVIAVLTAFSWKFPRIGGWFFVLLGVSSAFFFHPFLWNGALLGFVPLLIGVLFLAEGAKSK